MTKKVAIILADEFEDIELTSPRSIRKCWI